MPLFSTEQTANFNNFDKSVNEFLWFLDNEYIQAFLALFLILYAGVIAPKLSPSIMEGFNNIFVKILAFAAIVLISKKSPTIALITGIAVLVTLMIANNQIAIKFMVKDEKFAPLGPLGPLGPVKDENDVDYYPNETQYPVKMDDLAINTMKQNNVKVYGINETGYDDMDGSILDGESDDSVTVYGNPTHTNRMYDQHVINHNQSNQNHEDEEATQGEDNQQMIVELVSVPVNKMGDKIEEKSGEKVSQETRQEVLEEVVQVVSNRMEERKPITKEYIVDACKNAYQKKY